MSTTKSNRPTERNIAKWISSRARRMGFRGHDIEDVQQQIMLVLMDFRLDAEKANGASSQTAITSVIDRQPASLLDSSFRGVGIILMVQWQEPPSHFDLSLSR